MTGGVVDLIRVARSQIGTTEYPAGSNMTPYGAWFGWNGVSWCAIFAAWCLHQIGTDGLLPHSASVEVIYRAAEAKGWVDSTPTVGALPVYNFGTGFDHIGACVTRIVDPQSFYAVEGNTSSGTAGSQSNGGGVFERLRSTGLVHGFIHLPLESPMSIDANDAALIARTEEGYFTITTPDGRKETLHPAVGELLASGARIEAALARIEAALHAPVNVTVDVQKLAAAVVTALPATTLTVADIATAVANEQARRLARN